MSIPTTRSTVQLWGVKDSLGNIYALVDETGSQVPMSDIASAGIALISGERKYGKPLYATGARGYTFTAGQWKRNGVNIVAEAPNVNSTGLVYIQVDADVDQDISFVPTNPVYAAPAGKCGPDHPGAPTIEAAPGNNKITFTITPSAYTGGAPILESVVDAYDTFNNFKVASVYLPGNATTGEVTKNIKNGRNYYLKARQRNRAGWSNNSDASNVVSPSFGTAPTVTTNPTITGTPTVGATISATAATFAGTQPITVVRTWYVDDLLVATADTYKATYNDQGKALTVKETATNAGGSVTATSAAKTIGAAVIVLPSPYLMESFENSADWTMGGSATIADNTTWKQQGTKSLKMTGGASNATATMTKTIAGTFDPKVHGTIAVLANIDPSQSVNMVSAGLNLTRSGTGGTVSPLNGFNGSPPSLRTGVAVMAANIEKEMSAVYALAANTGFTLRMLQSQGASGGSIGSYDSLIGGAKGIPTIILNVDDNYSDQYTWLYQIMKARNLKFNINIVKGAIGTANRFTEAQFDEMFASGLVGIGLNGTVDDAAANQADPAAAVSGPNGIIANQDYVVSKGWITDRSKLTVGCWPFGTWNEALCVAFENAGIKWMRTTQPGVQLGNTLTRFGPTPQWLTGCSYSMGGKTAAQLKAAYDLCKAGGYTLNLYAHHFYETPSGSDVGWATFIEFLDYITPDIQDGSSQMLTIQDWITRDFSNTFPVLS